MLGNGELLQVKILSVLEPTSVHVHFKFECFVALSAGSVFVGVKEGEEKSFCQAVRTKTNPTNFMHKLELHKGDALCFMPGIPHCWECGTFLEASEPGVRTLRLFDPHQRETDPEALDAVDFETCCEKGLLQRMVRRKWTIVNETVHTVRPHPRLEISLFHMENSTLSMRRTTKVCEIIVAGENGVTVNDCCLKRFNAMVLPAQCSECTLSCTKATEVFFVRLKPESEASPPRVALSVGGTKMQAAVVDEFGILSASRRVLWRELQLAQDEFVPFLADLIAGRLRHAQVPFFHPLEVFVAWPGPGDYARGFVMATFVSGFEKPTDLAGPLQAKVSEKLAQHWKCEVSSVVVKVHVVFDAVASALGEAVEGRLYGHASATVLNLATGVAAALLHNRTIIEKFPKEGIAYGIGQLGRQLMLRPDGVWEYKRTSDGSVPELHGAKRLSLLVGGPYVAKRFTKLLESFKFLDKTKGLTDSCKRFMTSHSNHPLDEVLLRVLRTADVKKLRPEDYEAVLILLTKLAKSSQAAEEREHKEEQEASELALRVVREVAAEIGCALRVFFDFWKRHSFAFHKFVLLVGGVGQHFARFTDKRGVDVFCEIIRQHSGAHAVVRGVLNARELVAFKPGRPLDTLMTHSVTFETLQQFEESLIRIQMTNPSQSVTVELSVTSDNRTTEVSVPVPNWVMKDHMSWVVLLCASKLNQLAELFGLRGIVIRCSQPRFSIPFVKKLRDLAENEFAGTLKRTARGCKIGWSTGAEKAVGFDAHGSSVKVVREVPTAVKTVGIDVGGSSVKVVCVDGQRIVKSCQRNYKEDENLYQLLHKVMAELGLRNAFQHPVTILVPGSVTQDGRVHYLPNLQKSLPTCVEQLNALGTEYPAVTFLNDAKGALEYFVHTKQLTGTVVLLSLGTGLGIAAFHQGEVLRCFMEAHVRVNFSKDAPLHSCGNRGCLEPEASAEFVKGTPPGSDRFFSLGQNVALPLNSLCCALGVYRVAVVLAGGLVMDSRSREQVQRGIRSRSTLSLSFVDYSSFDDQANSWELTQTSSVFVGAVGAVLAADNKISLSRQASV